jgi:hypothetical protein
LKPYWTTCRNEDLKNKSKVYRNFLQDDDDDVKENELAHRETRRDYEFIGEVGISIVENISVTSEI